MSCRCRTPESRPNVLDPEGGGPEGNGFGPANRPDRRHRVPPGAPAAVLGWPADRAAIGACAIADLTPGPNFVGSVAILAPAPVRVLERDGSVLLRGSWSSPGLKRT
jgi:hypothetical protein